MNDWKHTILPAIGPVLVLVGLVVLEPDLGTALEIFIIAVAMLYVAGLNGKYILGAGLAAIPVVYLLIVRVSYRYERVMAFLNPDGGPAGPRLSADAIADRGRVGRLHRRRLDGEQAKTILFARSAYRFHFRGVVRRAGIHRRRDRAGLVRDLRLARDALRVQDHGRIRPLRRAGHHGDGPEPGA